MNLSRKNVEEYERDIIMIRDLIIAIERFNAITKNSHDNVRLIGSVRNEVINSVKSKGKEINKAIESYGIPIDWTQYDEESLHHPLIKLLINYFKISDAVSGIPVLDDETEYKKWVSDSIYNSSSEETIRNYTLYRPRHVVRLLNIAKIRCGQHRKITSATFNTVRRQYSSECWNEIAEDLALTYTPKELELIKEWLTGMPWQTSYLAMQEKAQRSWERLAEAERLLLKFDDIIRDLYQAGVIGNYCMYDTQRRPTHRWYFRGDEILLKDQPIQIHRIFSTVLSTVRP